MKKVLFICMFVILSMCSNQSNHGTYTAVNQEAAAKVVKNPIHPVLGLELDPLCIDDRDSLKGSGHVTYKNPGDSVSREYLKLPYKDLFRTPDSYTGQRFKVKGKVMQFFDHGNGFCSFLMQTKWEEYLGYYDNLIFVGYKGNRLVEGDIITVYGLFLRFYDYTTAQNVANTIPMIKGEEIILEKKAQD